MQILKLFVSVGLILCMLPLITIIGLFGLFFCGIYYMTFFLFYRISNLFHKSAEETGYLKI